MPRRLSLSLILGLILIGCTIGFVHFTQIALYKQAHFAPDSVHPYDAYAVSCLFLGMIALGIMLMRVPEPPRRLGRKALRIPRPKAAKPRRRSGYNRAT